LGVGGAAHGALNGHVLGGPAGGDSLLLGAETEAYGARGVALAEQGALQAAESGAPPRCRKRDGKAEHDALHRGIGAPCDATAMVPPACSASSVMRITRSRASGVITGGMSVAGSFPGPTTSFSASARMACRNGSWASPTVTATGTAMQRSPAEPKAPEAIWP